MLLGADTPSGGLDSQLQPLPGPGREEGGLRWAGGRLLTDCPCPTGRNVCKPQGPLASGTCSPAEKLHPIQRGTGSGSGWSWLWLCLLQGNGWGTGQRLVLSLCSCHCFLYRSGLD